MAPFQNNNNNYYYWSITWTLILLARVFIKLIHTWFNLIEHCCCHNVQDFVFLLQSVFHRKIWLRASHFASFCVQIWTNKSVPSAFNVSWGSWSLLVKKLWQSTAIQCGWESWISRVGKWDTYLSSKFIKFKTVIASNRCRKYAHMTQLQMMQLMAFDETNISIILLH